MSVEIAYADRSMINAVLLDLRLADVEELHASGVDFETLADLIMRHRIFAFCAWNMEHGPIAVWGMVRRRNGVGAGFAFGTDHWGEALLPMLRQIRGFVLPHLVKAGYHRVEAAALAGRDDVARFMALIDAEPEGVLRDYGVNREDFVSYRWLADEHRITRTGHQAQDQYISH